MTPGPVEEGAKVATSVVDALRTQPILLGLVIIIADGCRCGTCTARGGFG